MYYGNRIIDTGGRSRLVADNKICGECRYHQDDYHKDDWICVNPDSDYCADYTLYDDTCECFEQRGVE